MRFWDIGTEVYGIPISPYQLRRDDQDLPQHVNPGIIPLATGSSPWFSGAKCQGGRVETQPPAPVAPWYEGTLSGGTMEKGDAGRKFTTEYLGTRN